MILFSLLAAVTAPASDPTPRPAPFETAAPLDESALDKATAREDVALIATSEQTAQVSNNSIDGPSTTGMVSIDGNAFQNVQGLTIVSANSGNNVAINSSLNVTLNFSPN